MAQEQHIFDRNYTFHFEFEYFPILDPSVAFPSCGVVVVSKTLERANDSGKGDTA